MKENTIIPEFAPTKWSTSADKQRFVKQFIAFVESGFKESLFHKTFYTRLSMCRGHIAHYNKLGFYEEWFSSIDRQQNFIRVWATQPIYGDPAWTYSDVEEFLKNWLQQRFLK